MWMWHGCTTTTDDSVAVPRPLIIFNDLIRGSMRAVRGFWGRGADRGATVVHQIVDLEGGFTRRDRRCVGGVTRRDRRCVGVDVAFAFSENMSIYTILIGL